jgi:hypothetical protein
VASCSALFVVVLSFIAYKVYKKRQGKEVIFL